MNADARKEEYEHILLFGHPALLTSSRIDRETVPERWHCYDLRGSDYNPLEPFMVEDNIVVVNHAGTVLTPHDLKLDKEENRRRRIDNNLEYLDEMLTLQSFCEEYRIAPEEARSSGHETKVLAGNRDLRPEDISFGGEIVEMTDGTLNFYLESGFDVDAVFGTNVCTDEHDDTLNIYADYHMERDELSDILTLALWHGETCEDYAYPLSASEKKMLLEKMEEYCASQTGFSLSQYSALYRSREESGRACVQEQRGSMNESKLPDYPRQQKHDLKRRDSAR